MMGGHSVFVNKVVCAAAMLTQGAMRTMAFVGELIPVLPFPDRLWCNIVLLGKIHLFTIKRIFGLVIDSQVCLRPRDRFWDIPVPKIDSAFNNLFVPQPSWSPSTTQQLRKLVAVPWLAAKAGIRNPP